MERKHENVESADLRSDSAMDPEPRTEHREVAWRGFAPGSWEGRSTSATSSSATTPLTSGDGAFLDGPTERTTGLWRTLRPLLDAEREKGILRCLAGSVEHPRARTGLHRQAQRDHRRPPDRRAAQARDHAVRRLARGRCEPRVLRLQAGRPCRRNLHQVPQDPQRRRLRRLHGGHQGRTFIRDRDRACPTRTVAAASSATIAGLRSTASTSSSPTRSVRRTNSTTATRPRK